MAQVPRSLLDSLNESLGALSDAGRQMVDTALSRLADVYADTSGKVPTSNIAALRDASIELMEQICSELCDLAAVEAAESYAEQRQIAGAESVYATTADSRRVPQATAEAVRGLVQTVVKTGETSRYTQQLADRVDYEIKRAANECAAFNAEADSECEGYYRVPVGKETCSYCLMLAAFGLQEGNADKVGHVHTNCDCRVVAAYNGVSIEGYDHDKIYERYCSCLDTLGGRDGIRADWDALPESKRNAYIASHGKSKSKAFDAYVNKRVAAEIETRDPEWYLTGKEPEIGFEIGAAPLKKETDVASWLKQAGFQVTFRATRSKLEKRTSDCFLGSTAWEIKQPIGAGKRNISNQFNEAQGQSDKIILDISRSPWLLNDIIEEAQRQINLRDDFSECLIIAEKYTRRIKQQ